MNETTDTTVARETPASSRKSRKLLKIFAAIILLVAVAIGIVFYSTAAMVNSGDAFFQSLQENDLENARLQLTESFNNNTSDKQLEQFRQHNNLANLQDTSWSSRSRNGNTGELVGSATTANGEVVPLRVILVNQLGDWKIRSIVAPPSGLISAPDPMQPAIPVERELIQLVNQSTRAFTHSVNARSMEEFHRHVSELWRSQATAADLDSAFAVFYQSSADFTVLNDLAPRFTGPASLDAKGIMTVEGVYPTTPSQFRFSQEYIYEGLGWKLIGFRARVD